MAFGQFLITFIKLYTYLIIARCLLSFFPAIDWHNPIFAGIRQVTDPVMEPFRRVIPPIGGLDLSPIVLIFILQMLQGIIATFFYVGPVL